MSTQHEGEPVYGTETISPDEWKKAHRYWNSMKLLYFTIAGSSGLLVGSLTHHLGEVLQQASEQLGQPELQVEGINTLFNMLVGNHDPIAVGLGLITFGLSLAIGFCHINEELRKAYNQFVWGKKDKKKRP